MGVVKKGGGERRKSKPHLTSFQQQTLCELQDPNCKFSFGETVPHWQSIIYLWFAETSQTSFNILHGKQRVNSPQCFLHLEKFGWETWRFLGLVGAAVGFAAGLLPCVLWCSLFPFQKAICFTQPKPFSGVKTLQPHLHLWASRADLIPQAGYCIWEQGKELKAKGKESYHGIPGCVTSLGSPGATWRLSRQRRTRQMG